MLVIALVALDRAPLAHATFVQIPSLVCADLSRAPTLPTKSFVGTRVTSCGTVGTFWSSYEDMIVGSGLDGVWMLRNQSYNREDGEYGRAWLGP